MSTPHQTFIPPTQYKIEQIVNQILCGDALTELKRFPDECIDSVVTSPPYFHLRDFGVKNQIGLENTVDEYLERLLAVFAEIKRVLKPQGTCWVNMGDTYSRSTRTGAYYLPAKEMQRKFTAGNADKSSAGQSVKPPPKCLLQIPSRFALKMVEQGWILRNEIIWHKPNCVPSSVKDRFTVDFEKVFFFVKQKKYYFEQQFEPLTNPERLKRRYFKPETKRKWDNKKSPFVSVNPESIEKSRARMLAKGRNKRCVWRISPSQFSGNHFAVFPPALVETPIKAGCPKDGIVLDPFMGSGTTAITSKLLGRYYIGIELNPKYTRMANQRLLS